VDVGAGLAAGLAGAAGLATGAAGLATGGAGSVTATGAAEVPAGPMPTWQAVIASSKLPATRICVKVVIFIVQ